MEYLRSDIRRYLVTEEVAGFRQAVYVFLFNYSLWVIISYRFGRWVRNDLKVPVVKQILKIVTRISHELLCLVTGIKIPFETDIGRGLYIGYTGMLIISPNAKIGLNCNIGAGVVIGQAGRGDKTGSPIIGNNVYVGAGAKVIGKIVIGDHVAIGANAVVVKDVPAHATVVGIPAKVINYFGSGDFVKLPCNGVEIKERQK